MLEAADNLLVERGFAALTIEAIAARAGVAKQTIYRWWDSKVDILMDAFVDDAAAYLTAPDAGDLGDDLRNYLGKLAQFLTKTDAGAVFRALAGHALHDPEVASRFRSDYLARQREWERVPLQRAVERGELARDTDIDAAIDELVGPIYYRVLVTGQMAPREFTDRLVDNFVRENQRASTKEAGPGKRRH